jgi:hypothetical protein
MGILLSVALSGFAEDDNTRGEKLKKEAIFAVAKLTQAAPGDLCNLTN